MDLQRIAIAETEHPILLVAASIFYSTMTGTAKATETNMWEAKTMGMPWQPWVIVAAVAVGLAIFFVHRRRAAQTK